MRCFLRLLFVAASLLAIGSCGGGGGGGDGGSGGGVDGSVDNSLQSQEDANGPAALTVDDDTNVDISRVLSEGVSVGCITASHSSVSIVAAYEKDAVPEVVNLTLTPQACPKETFASVVFRPDNKVSAQAIIPYPIGNVSFDSAPVTITIAFSRSNIDLANRFLSANIEITVATNVVNIPVSYYLTNVSSGPVSAVPIKDNSDAPVAPVK